MSTYTPTLGLEEIAPGTQAGLWGDTTNNNLRLIDQAVTGVTPLSFAGVSGTTITLDDFNGAPSEARSAVLNITGGATGSNTVVVPNKQKTYLVRNNTGQNVVFRTPTPSATFTVGAGNSILIFCDGGNNVFTGIASPSVGTLGVAGGGTGATTFTSGFVVSSGGTSSLVTQPSVGLGGSATNQTSGQLQVANGGTGATTFTAGFVKSTGGTNVLTSAAGVALGSEVSGILPVANGGTGIATTPTNGQLDIGNGTGFTRAALTAGSGISITNGAGSITIASTAAATGVTSFSGGFTGLLPSAATTGAVALSGTLSISNGGTGATTTIGARSNLGIGTVGQLSTNGSTTQFLRGDGTFVVPSYTPYPSAGVAVSTGSAWGTSLTTNGTGTTLALTNSPQLTLPPLSTATVTPATGGQGNATPIVSDINYVSATVINSGVILPTISAAQVGRKIRIYNPGSVSLRIYPPVSGFIDNNAVNAFITIFNSAYIDLVAQSTTVWNAYSQAISTAGFNSYALGANDGVSSQLRIATNDGTNVGSKTFRVATYLGNPNGILEILNNAYTTVLVTLFDNGDFILNNSSLAQKPSGTTWANPSDIRLKNKITNYTDGLSKLMQVTPKTWEYNGKGGTTAGVKGLGVIADEIQSVLPNTVDMYSAKLDSEDAEPTDIKRFDATEITWLLVNSVKELKAELDAAKAEIAALKAKV